MPSPHIGSSFDDYLREAGIYEDVTADAVKQVVAWQIERYRQEQGLSTRPARERMATRRRGGGVARRHLALRRGP